jgi:hypothetical protein
VRTVLKTAALTVALAAMVLRAALPMGWMPSAAAGAPLMLCPGAGPTMAAMPAMPGMDMPKAPAPDQAHGKQAPCAFDMVGPLSAPASAPPAALPVAVSYFVAFADRQEAPPLAPRFRPNAPRAPPFALA